MATALPTVDRARSCLPTTYRHRRGWKLFSTSAKPIICRPYHAASIECSPVASNEVAAARPRVNAWGAFLVFVGELGSSRNKQNQQIKLE